MRISQAQLEEMIPKDLQEMNPHIFGKRDIGLGAESDEKCHGVTPGDQGGAEDPQEPFDGAEKAMQAEVEKWLVARGYGRRTPKTMQAHHTGRWFIHLNQAKGNPILLDLVLLDSTRGTYVEIELKVKGGALTPDQNSLVLTGQGAVCWGVDQFKDAVRLWEQATTTSREDMR